MRKVGRGAGVALAILFAGLVTQTIVSACTVFTTFNVRTLAGPPGSQVAVYGEAFQQAPVDVYWGSINGPHLATVTTINFSDALVTIPANAAPGSYFLVATDHTGAIASVTSNNAFTVTSAAPPPTPTPVPTAVPTPNPTSAPTGSAPSGQPSSPSAPAPGPALVASGTSHATATANHASNHGSVNVAAPGAAPAPGKSAVSGAPGHPRAGTPSAAPSLGALSGAGGPITGLPTPVLLGLVFAGLSVLGAAGFGAFVIPRRRRAHAAEAVDTSFDENRGA